MPSSIKKIFLFSLAIALAPVVHSQEAFVAFGGDASSSGGSVSYSGGQVGYTYNSGSGGSVWEGVQQIIIPAGPGGNTIANIKVFIQGYYQGGGNMASALQNSNISGATSSQSDSITIELHNSSNGALVGTPVKTILSTTGNATVDFSTLTGSYYLVIRHRNALETWSASPISFSGTISYDFTTAANKAFGDNQVNMGGGAFAMYSGDVNQDGAIESADYSSMENDVLNILFGYNNTDLNGDGVVESSDYALMENNVLQIIFVARPF